MGIQPVKFVNQGLPNTTENAWPVKVDFQVFPLMGEPDKFSLNDGDIKALSFPTDAFAKAYVWISISNGSVTATISSLIFTSDNTTVASVPESIINVSGVELPLVDTRGSVTLIIIQNNSGIDIGEVRVAVKGIV
ncbi:hypothetical protein [Ammoniphilus resinae]|uniref:Uncharacterized protein n=1 Tax=Ammoniphilus resinae TaxID=861532 RepID=A0ABS4GXF9_9BACL|nr:hypothetical protein [Ammoniphilus resinae]MBP1934949.1 hypothetical protein [Ammoniphilus resinae]